jgi:hypothetical protein
MANKTLGTRQKLSFRIEPSQGFAKPRNPLAACCRGSWQKWRGYASGGAHRVGQETRRNRFRLS